jgi:uncharacterized protein (DUF952 family)
LRELLPDSFLAADSPVIFHIATQGDVERAQPSGEYVPEAFARERFIHCSYREQVVAVANRLFAGRRDLVLLEIDPQKLSCPIVDENLEGGLALFPHIYGRLPMTAVVAIHPFLPDEHGRFQSV